MTQTANVTFKDFWKRLVEERAVTVILPPDKLQTLVCGLHRRRAVERKLLESVGADEVMFEKAESIRVVKDKDYGIDDDGCLRATIIIAPVQKATYTIVSEDEPNAAT